jgi:hypothetical protein
MAGDRELYIVVVERSTRPCLILPLQLTRMGRGFGLGVAVLEPVGMAQDVNRPRLALGAHDPDAYAYALSEIWRRRGDWHLIRIFEISEDDAEVGILESFAKTHKLKFRQRFSHLCPWLDLQQPWEQYLAGRSSSLRRNLRAARRRLEQQGVVTLRTFDTEQDIMEGFALLQEVYRHSWKASGQIEYSSSKAYASFYGGWLACMAARERARVLVLFCGENPVAATLIFMDDQSVYGAQIAHDSRFDACSPGRLLQILLFEQLMQSGKFRLFDFMGGFLANKLCWTDNTIRTQHLYVLRNSLIGFAFDTYSFHIKPVVKPLLERVSKLVRARAA